MAVENGGLIQAGTVPEIATPKEDGRAVEVNFDILPTHISDFFLLVDHGMEPGNLTRSQTSVLRNTGNVFAARREAIRHLQELQKEPHDELVSLGINNPGLRGARDLVAGVEVQITPSTKDFFDEDLLDQSLGDRSKELVHKKVTVTVELDPDRDDVEGFIVSVRRRLKRQGMSSEAIEQKLNVERPLRVDIKELEKLVKAGEVVLIPGAWGKQIEKWSITPRVIPTKEELAEADEEAKSSI